MKKDDIPFDGFGNVIEMLKASDAAFRDKIIRNIAARDPGLAKRLMEATRTAIAQDQLKQEPVRRDSQRNYLARNYKNF